MLFALLVFAISCGKEKGAADDYLIFGHFYGECLGEGCIEIYKLEIDQLTEDINDSYPSGADFYGGDYTTELTQEKLNIASALWDLFPDKLFDEEDTVLGMPDAGDWGGLYVEYKKGDKHAYWVIDQMKKSIPEYTHSFHDKVNEVIEEIR